MFDAPLLHHVKILLYKVKTFYINGKYNTKVVSYLLQSKYETYIKNPLLRMVKAVISYLLKTVKVIT